VHSLSPCYVLLTALVLLKSVAIWCNVTQFFTKICVILHACVHGCWTDFFPGVALMDFSKSFSRGRGKVVKFVFYHSKLKKRLFS